MSLVNDVLELSRIEEGDIEAEMHILSLRQAAEAAMRSVNLMAKDKEINLTLKISEPLPMVLMNEEAIERVIINLLTNAIKYTPQGGKIEIKMEGYPQTNEVGVLITDTGIGIPEESLPQIFDRFYRVERKVHTIKGTGLGLTIVKKIVENHKGRVEVKSSLGQGSIFSFYLPTANEEQESSLSVSPTAKSA